MTENPLAGLVPLFVPREAGPTVTWRWARVTSVDPLRVQYPTDPSPGSTAPLSLLPGSALRMGARVLVMKKDGQDTIIGATAYGAQDHTAWTTLTPIAPWTTYTAFGGTPRVRLIGDRVELRGCVTGAEGGQAQTIAVLPTWARPSTSSRLLDLHRADGAASAQITTTGELFLRTSGPTGYASLDGVTYHL